MIEKLGRIESTNLTIDRRGIMTINLDFNFDGRYDSFPHYSLDSRESTPLKMGMDLIISIIKACGVDSWENVKGDFVYGLFDDETGMMEGIKATSYKGGQFLISEWIAKWLPEARR